MRPCRSARRRRAKAICASPRIIDAARRSRRARRSIPATASCRRTPAFAEACAEAGIVFVGPPAAAIRAMGSKSAAKALMETRRRAAGAGYHGDDAGSATSWPAEAARIGYPVLIKAVAGGGGKGMRVVDTRRRFRRRRLASAQREAASAFGDDRVLIEKLSARGRAISRSRSSPTRTATRASVRARLLGPAPAPEGARGSAGARA